MGKCGCGPFKMHKKKVIALLRVTTKVLLEWTTSLDTSSSTLFVCRGLYPAGFIAHLRLYRHIRQAAIREFFLFAVGSHAVIIYFGWLGLALYNIVVRIMVRVDVRVRVTQG